MSPSPAPVPDPYRPLPPEGAGGEADPESTGTLFLMVFFLMLIAGFWGIMYITLLGR